METIVKKVNLGLVNGVKEFVQETCKAPFDVTVGGGRFMVDGKSIMGVFSLDLSKPVEIRFESDNDAAIAAYLEAIEKFIVEE